MSRMESFAMFAVGVAWGTMFYNSTLIILDIRDQTRKEKFAHEKFIEALKNLERNPFPTMEDKDDVYNLEHKMAPGNILDMQEEANRVYSLTNAKIYKANQKEA